MASSPCVKLCLIDDASGLCAGCGRTLAEIAGWGRLGEPERLAIMAVLPARLASAEDQRDQEARRDHEQE